jgi:tryptophanyl-tRNA synthetase
MRILSGIKPSGDQVHIGNFLGALKQWVTRQDQGEHECIYFIANQHALTSIRDGDTLRKYTLNIAMQYLAVGLDPEKSLLFVQSDVPYHTEMTWIFNCLCPMGLLERAHAYKDSKAKGKELNVGVFDYPVLMAVDILMYQPQSVPVGKDQKQHVEIARDLAEKFNHIYGDTFVLPEAHIPEAVASVVGLDGRKMSKSYGNTIGLFEDEKTILKKVKSIQTDSKGLEESKDPDTCNVFSLLKHFAPDDVLADTRSKYLAGGYGYGHAKLLLFEVLMAYFKDIRTKHDEYQANPDFVKSILATGAEKANTLAFETMKVVREKVGY